MPMISDTVGIPSVHGGEDAKGWMFLSAHHPRPGMAIRVWGLLTLPPIDPIAQLPDPAQKAFHDRWVHYHSLAAWLMIGLLLLHVAGAIKHQIMDGENSFARIGIGRSRP